MDSSQYDVVIAGAGPAGCVLAVRLTEDPNCRVLLLEAGPDYGSDAQNWPAELLDPVGLETESHSWGYVHDALDSGRELPLPRARVVGGSSTVNGCIWLRGSRRDYDDWVARSNPGWGFDDLLPYFKRAEADPGGDSELHGTDGPITVSRAADRDLSPLDTAFLATADELGFDYAPDFNATEEQRPGVGRTPKNVVSGNRFNAALSYLAMARGRSNLDVVPEVLVDRLLFDGRVVTGVCTADGKQYSGGQVILAGGAYGSPAVLLRSGVGPADELADLGIEPAVDLPGVGRNLMDHPQIARQSGLTSFFIQPEHAAGRKVFIQTMIKARSRQVDDEIDIHIYPGEAYDDDLGAWLLAFGVSLQYARSTGTVRLTSPEPEAPLKIDHNYFSDPVDLEAISDGYELMLRLVETPPLSTMLQGPLRPGPHLTDRDALREVVKVEVGTTYHPSTTCKMGPARDRLAVVDSTCRVRGLSGVRVVDASVLPFGPRANLHFTTVALAERAADLIQRDGLKGRVTPK